MKKSSIKKICAAIIVIIAIMILAALLRFNYDSVPRFEFLDGKGKLIKVEEEYNSLSKVKEILYTCSFEADFNDIYIKANTELSGLGYTLSEYPNEPRDKHEYSWNDPDYDEFVFIMENLELKLYRDVQGSGQLKSNDKYRDGWVTVIVLKNKKRNWLISYLDMLSEKLRH